MASFVEWERRLATRKMGTAEAWVDELLRDWGLERAALTRGLHAADAEAMRWRGAHDAVLDAARTILSVGETNRQKISAPPRSDTNQARADTIGPTSETIGPTSETMPAPAGTMPLLLETIRRVAALEMALIKVAPYASPEKGPIADAPAK